MILSKGTLNMLLVGGVKYIAGGGGGGGGGGNTGKKIEFFLKYEV